jgi:type 1 glutamine amidotransferase
MKRRTARRHFLKQSALAGVGFLAASGLAARADSDQPIRALLIIGGCCHDYVKQKDLIPTGVSARANVQWKVAYDPDKGTRHVNPVYANADWARGFDVVVHDECCSDVTDLKVIKRILAPHQAGLPAVLLHCGLHCYRSEGYPKVTPWFEFTGLQTTGHGPQAPIAVTYLDRESTIIRGLKDWKTGNEELYNNITGKVLETAHPLARGKQTFKLKDDKESTAEAIVTWTNMYQSMTRVFATTLGHNNETVADGRYLELVTRGLLWSVGKLDDDHLKPARRVFLEESAPPK